MELGVAGSASSTDAELLARIASGDSGEPVGMLYDRYARRVYGLGLHQLGSATLAEDLVQDTFVRIWQTAGSYDPTAGSVATFVFTIARRRAIDLWRRAQARPAEGAEAHEQGMPNRVDELLVGLAVREALDDLSPQFREVLELTHTEGLKQSEIAARLGIPVGTVKTRTFHAARALRAALDARGVHA